MSESLRSASRTLSEHDSKRRLAEFGIPMAPEHLVDTADQAADAARQLGGAVVVKLCGDQIAHKTEPERAHAAAAELLAAARPEDGEVQILVAAMIEGRRELIAGCLQDPTFGPCVMLGIGGIFAEALADAVFRLVPIERVDAEEMIDDLRNQRMLGEFRGEPAIDREALAEVLVALSRLSESDPDILSADINPLILSGGRPIAVDGLIEVRKR
jgi:succinyl-CoA synthetase beta subunit